MELWLWACFLQLLQAVLTRSHYISPESWRRTRGSLWKLNKIFFRGHEGNISISTDIKKWDVWWYLWLIDLSQSQVWYKVQMLNLPFGLIWFASNLGQFLEPNYFRTLVVCWCHKAWCPTVPAPLSSASRGWEEVFRWQKLLLVGSPRRTRSHGKVLELKKHLATFNK